MNKIFLIAFAFLITPTFLLAQIPSGIIAQYLLDGNTAPDQSGNNYNGTLTNTVTTSNRFGTSNSAIALTAGVSTGSLPVSLVTAVQNDFSMSFWFKTSMTAPNSSAWYGGTALIDAEVCGATSDWGVALIDGGGVCFGIGVYDITIKSPLNNYNDGTWHFVTVTRNATAGTIKLYIAGTQVALSTTTTTVPLTAPNSIRLGSNPCAPNGVYTGSLDDVLFYNRVLTDTEVTSLYTTLNSYALSLEWISFSGNWQNNKAQLQWEVAAVINNDRFEIEHATDGINFTSAGTVLNNAGVNLNNKLRYNFTDNNFNSSATNYYRIKQIDIDGKFSYSKTIKLSAAAISSKKLYLRSNPVAGELVLMNDEQTLIQQLEIADASGRKVTSQQLKSTDAIIRSSVQQLKAGYYTVKIYTANGFTVIPFVKQ